MASIPLLREAALPRSSTLAVAEVSERVMAGLLLATSIPLLCASAAALALLSRRSPLIAHRRVGRRDSTLWMLKLRTMWDDNSPERGSWLEYIDDETGPLGKNEQDSRVPSRFARFCRRHSIDELPQLLHVLRGEMSFVGPRPLTAAELRRYYGNDAPEILEAKPGITGLWQVSGRNRLSYAERRALDLKLVRGRSLGMYLRILVRTGAAIWTGANSW